MQLTLCNDWQSYTRLLLKSHPKNLINHPISANLPAQVSCLLPMPSLNTVFDVLVPDVTDFG